MKKILVVDSGKRTVTSEMASKVAKTVVINTAHNGLETVGFDYLHLITNCTDEKKKLSYRQSLHAFSSGRSK